ncbi:MAG: Zn-dependent hydrolase [Anaerolineales bacterium]
MANDLRIDPSRLLQRLDELARLGGQEHGGVSRLALSDADRQARDLFVSWLKEPGLSIHIDQVGNIIGLRPGQEDLPPVMFGSHIDSVRGGGRYDGAYGVLAALEVLSTLHDRQIATRHPLAVVAFTNEEGARYAPDMLGSLAFIGDLSVEAAWAATGFDGSNFGQELQRIGYAGKMQPGAIQPSAYLELHIEQGPTLEQEGLTIGIVDRVTGITWLEAVVSGAANHAGTTPIALRRDAGLAAAKIIQYLRQLALDLGGDQRATCGIIRLEPNVINVIPGRAVFTIDLRNSDESVLQEAEQRLRTYATYISKQEGVEIEIRPLSYARPQAFDPRIVDAVAETAQRLGYPHKRMPSGAGHDAQIMARKYPTGMIFIPSRGGVSHSPLEYSSPTDLEAGANVLLHTVLKLAA